MTPNTLEVGLSTDGCEVIVNHPDLKPDEHGVGHIVFSPQQALMFALIVRKKGEEARRNATAKAKAAHQG